MTTRTMSQPKQASVGATASGNTQLLAAVAGIKFVVVWALVVNAGASPIKVQFQSATTGITAAHECAADGGGWSQNASPMFVCQTVAGEALNVNLAAAGDVGVTIGYFEVTP